jgi:signal peptidase I
MVSRLSYWLHSPQAGDIVVFELVSPSGLARVVKRIIGTPGDLLSERDGWWFRNGIRLAEPYVSHRGRGDVKPVRVGPSRYYVLGDNRTFSRDSRDFGAIARSAIVGKVCMIYAPFHRIRRL